VEEVAEWVFRKEELTVPSFVGRSSFIFILGELDLEVPFLSGKLF